MNESESNGIVWWDLPLTETALVNPVNPVLLSKKLFSGLKRFRRRRLSPRLPSCRPPAGRGLCSALRPKALYLQQEKLLIAHDVIDFARAVTGLGDILLFRIFSEAYGEGRDPKVVDGACAIILQAIIVAGIQFDGVGSAPRIVKLPVGADAVFVSLGGAGL